jgi:23S rRNA pseudouridine2605 synthase
VAKALARAGVASRRDIERLIVEGRVALNGRVLDTPAVKVAPGDVLTVDGDVVGNAEPTRVWRYHKPAGLVTTHKDPHGRPTVFEHLPKGLPRVISVGRLDLNSEGLLVLTNDGGLARALELPSSGWVRRYRARAYGRTTQARLDSLKNGITVEGVHYGPIEARLDKVQRRPGDSGKDEAPANVWITVALTEGKNREVRRVLEALGLKVNRLIRLAYGPFALGTLEPGAAEEVGPRVIREQLAEFIAPANLPKGDRRPAPLAPATPLRRGSAQRPTHKAAHPGESREPGPPGGKSRSGKALSARSGQRPDTGGEKSPGSGFRRDERKQGAEAAPAKKAYKPGWARPKPRTKPAPAGSKPRRGPAKPR